MGSQQSQLNPEVAAHEKAVLQQLRAMQLENKENSDYVYVSGDAGEKGSPAALRKAEDLSVDELQEWQKRLLEDPKNR
jgi:hypothetical protein